MATVPESPSTLVIGWPAGLLTVDEIAGLHSTWAKRLRHGRDGVALTLIDAQVR